jgi:hypothetical protein
VQVKAKKHDAWSNHFHDMEVKREKERLAEEVRVLQALIKLQVCDSDAQQMPPTPTSPTHIYPSQ